MSVHNGATRYPWDKWFAKQRFKLVQGKDYTCMTHSMIAQIRSRAAYDYHVRVVINTKQVDDKDVIDVTVR